MKKSDFLSFIIGSIGCMLFAIGAFTLVFSSESVLGEGIAPLCIGFALILVAVVIHQILDKQESSKRKKN